MNMDRLAQGYLWRHYVIWACVAGLFGFTGLICILAFADIHLVPDSPISFFNRFPVVDTGAHGSVITAAFTWVGGTIALFTYFLNREQKERHNRAQERRERDLSELQRLESEFAALARDFAQPAALAQINSAIGLGEIAKRPDPRRVDSDGFVLDDGRQEVTWTKTDGSVAAFNWPSEWRSATTERNYPYFSRSTNRLIAALQFWDDEAARAQAIRELKILGEWAIIADHSVTDEPLLHSLINSLAEANRTAWRLLKDKCAICMAFGVSRDKLVELLGISDKSNAMWPVGQQNWAKAKSAFVELLCSDIERLPSYLANKSDEAVHTNLRIPLNDFRIASQGFFAIRDALAVSLRTLSMPPEDALKELSTGLGVYLDPSSSVGSSNWGRRTVSYEDLLRHRKELDLSAIVLFDADCESANLHGVNCSYAHFIGVNFAWTHFDGAILHNATFLSTHCIEAHLDSAFCVGVEFKHSIFYGAHFDGTIFNGATFLDVDFRKSFFAGARLGQDGSESVTVDGLCNWSGVSFFYCSESWDGSLRESVSIDKRLIEYFENCIFQSLDE